MITYLPKISSDLDALGSIGSYGGWVVPIEGNYTILSTDQIILSETAGATLTLPTAVGISGKIFTITNGSNGSITVNTTSSQTISGSLTQTLSPSDSMDVYSNGTNYYIK